MMQNGLKTNEKYNDPTGKTNRIYPVYCDKEVENKISAYLQRRYEEKGRDFFFKASQLPFPSLSAQRIGAALRRIKKDIQIVEKWNTGQIMVWHTKFNSGLKSGKSTSFQLEVLKQTIIE